MFVTFNVPALYVASQSYLSLLVTSREIGMSLNIGDCSLIAVPIYESCPSIYAFKKSLVSGNQLTDYFSV